jgi:hypothetical protein
VPNGDNNYVTQQRMEAYVAQELQRWFKWVVGVTLAAGAIVVGILQVAIATIGWIAGRF